MNSCHCYFPKMQIALSSEENLLSFSIIQRALNLTKTNSLEENSENIFVKIKCLFSQEISILPEWLQTEIISCDFSIQPRLFYKTHQLAAVVKENQTLFCALLNRNDNSIDFITISSREPHGGIYTPLITILFREILNSYGYTLLHSAAVCYPDGTGALIIGESGHGKTTTALSLVRHGARLLGDDLTLIELKENSVIAHGVPERLNITEDTYAFFDELKEMPLEALSRKNQLKKTVDPEAVYGESCWQNKTEINYIFFPEISKKGPLLKPLKSNKILEKLIKSHGFCCDQKTDADAMYRLISIADITNSYKLFTGDDPASLGSWMIKKSQILKTINA
ncbi:hypothetical protein MTBBW1_60013 [Desulfamplus magnetovallimortis]|uniref:HPr kinase n=1 Tax=Desulfamplus magnetovallimortis TaxID=1246637 RepID=A0A1W1HI63_9BACT|nr:hypothetical protein [Desulfamplus magnetovallimortis]SLM32113.1 hypothetical protein MTBBW1_60013 [Desulfamplus magnetovallimortis]